MKKKIDKIIVLTLVVLLLGNLVVKVQATETEKVFLTKEVEQIKNVVEQLDAMLQSGYLNIVEGRSNKGLIGSTNSYSSQIKELEQTLNEVQVTEELTTSQVYKVLALKRAVDYLVYLDKNLIDYLKAKDPITQFGFLKNQILVSGFLEQIVDYVDRE
ncbi:MAG: hypothetical protein ACRC1P_04420 [Cellulosilyticaceae bacterium]